LLRRSNESRRARSVAEHIPDHAGVAYSTRETTVAWKMSCRDVAGVPCARSTRIAYSMRLLDDSSVATWSAAVSLSFTITPRTRRLVSRLMSGHGGGGGAQLRPAEKTISFVLSRLSWRLFAIAHVCRCSSSAWHVSALTPGTTRYVSSAKLKILLHACTGCRSAAVTMNEAGPRAEP